MTVLLISSDSIDVQMAGPGIRYWEFAKHLSKKHDVILLTPNPSTLSHPCFQILHRTKQSFAKALQRADIVVTQGYLYEVAPLITLKKPLVVDLYDPLPIELLEHHAHLSLNVAQLSQSYCVERTKLLLQRGDFFLYSHERQRDYWLGILTAIGRVNHQHYRADSNFVKLFACVPYGVSDEKPVQTRRVLRGKESMVGENDTIVLWGGGLWQWLDPCSVIRAIGEIAKTRHDIKLFFLGGKRAETDTTGINIAYSLNEAIELSQQLGVYGRSVFFNETWVPYTERQNYFLDADIGISTHFETLETRFAFRTRLLDYLWTELPIITTKGDYLSNLVEQHHLGIAVPPADIRQIQEAILCLTDDQAFSEQCRTNIRRMREQLLWSEIIKPLEAFCDHPYQTCQMTLPALWWRLFKFYVNTGKILIRYRGYQKILAKIRNWKQF